MAYKWIWIICRRGSGEGAELVDSKLSLYHKDLLFVRLECFVLTHAWMYTGLAVCFNLYPFRSHTKLAEPPKAIYCFI